MTSTALAPTAASPAFVRSTIGRKIVMAVTGIALVGFVIGHMAGNLQMFLPNGREAMREYAIALREFLHGSGLWLARGGLVVSAILHIWAAASLTLESRAARPVGYKAWKPRQSTLYSRTMRISGVLLLAYVVYHLLHMTWGTVHPDFTHLDPYQNLVIAFQSTWVAWAYSVAMVLLGAHLHHGIWSMLRTLGISHPAHMKLAHAASVALAIIVVLGYVSVPFGVLLGVLR